MAPGWSSPASPIGKRAHSSQRQAGCGEAKLVVGKHYAYVRRSGKAETVFTLVHLGWLLAFIRPSVCQ
jgi:hypothetical protein